MSELNWEPRPPPAPMILADQCQQRHALLHNLTIQVEDRIFAVEVRGQDGMENLEMAYIDRQPISMI